MPTDLRAPILRILLEHADGALERRGRMFVPVDAMRPDLLSRPHPLEKAYAREAGGRSGGNSRTPTRLTHLWGELSWPTAKRRLSEVDVALLPVGAIEQHGHHLPLDTDMYDADRLAREVALACSDPKPLVLPVIPYGVSYHHDDYPGTISVGPDTLARLVIEVGMSAARNGVRKLLIINGHGGNGPALHFAAQMINRDARIFTCVDSGETSDADIEAMVETPNDVHAGETETSTSLALRPSLVDLDAARPDVPSFSSHYLDFSSHRGVGWYARTSRLSKTGVLGDPTKASAEKGVAMWTIMVRNLMELVEDIKSLSLDEIHQRRY
jgi:creatinine amidohydrolase/Fe(II)-dependent formamide hydrolase-like protein